MQTAFLTIVLNVLVKILGDEIAIPIENWLAKDPNGANKNFRDAYEASIEELIKQYPELGEIKQFLNDTDIVTALWQIAFTLDETKKEAFQKKLFKKNAQIFTQIEIITDLKDFPIHFSHILKKNLNTKFPEFIIKFEKLELEKKQLQNLEKIIENTGKTSDDLITTHIEKKYIEKIRNIGGKDLYIHLRAWEEMEKREIGAKSQIEKHVYEQIHDELTNRINAFFSGRDLKSQIHIISGGPGYGKSLCMLHLAYQQEKKEDRQVYQIDIENFNDQETLLNIKDKLREYRDASKKKNILFLLDGLDELSLLKEETNSFDLARKFLSAINKFIDGSEKAQDKKVLVIISGRIHELIGLSAVEFITNYPILHLLPLFVMSNQKGISEGGAPSEYELTNEYEKKLLKKDQRIDWWEKYLLQNIDDLNSRNKMKTVMMEILKNPDNRYYRHITEITSIPQLNFLFSELLKEGKLKLEELKQLNKYSLYNEILSFTFHNKEHPVIEGMNYSDYIDFFERLAKIAWHTGGGKGVSHLYLSLKDEKEKKNLIDYEGVNRVIAFYMIDSKKDSCEFIHKSFVDFLVARKIINLFFELNRNKETIRKLNTDTELGKWLVDEWLPLCGPKPVTEGIIGFLVSGMNDLSKEDLEQIKITLETIYIYLQKYEMPVHMVKNSYKNEAELAYKEQLLWSTNAEVALWAVVNSCMLALNKTTIATKIPKRFNVNEQSLGEFHDRHMRLQSIIDEKLIGIYNSFFCYIDLHDADFHNANLKDANLENTNLENTNLKGADLSGTNLHKANLHNANLEDANLSSTNLSETNLVNAKLNNANLLSTNLHNGRLHGADLSGTNLHKANLHNANLEGANLRYADLRDTDLNNAILIGVNLRYADLSYTNMFGADLSYTDFTDTNLNSANLIGTNLSKAFNLGKSKNLDLTIVDKTTLCTLDQVKGTVLYGKVTIVEYDEEV